MAVRRAVLRLLPHKNNLFRAANARWISSESEDIPPWVARMYLRPEIGIARDMLQFGVRGIYLDQHDVFREKARSFFQKEVLPYHAEWEREGQVSAEVWQKAGLTGLLGWNTTFMLEGMGKDTRNSNIVLEEQMYVNCKGPGFVLHSDIVMPYISGYGTQEQINRFIPRMVGGTCIGAIAVTESEDGSDLEGIQTTAKRDGDDYILNGHKTCVTNGYMCGVVVVVARTNMAAKSAADSLSLFLVEEGTPGFTKRKMLNKVGLKAQDTSELFFEDVRLPQSALLGEENEGFRYLMQELPQECLAIASMGQASCEWMFEEIRNYFRERKAFGHDLSKLQWVQKRLAEMKTEICIGRAFIDQCLLMHRLPGLDSSTAAMAKCWVLELQNRVAKQCLEMHGGWGGMLDHPIARTFLDACIHPVCGGSSEMLKDLIAGPIISDNPPIYTADRGKHWYRRPIPRVWSKLTDADKEDKASD